ncbi:phage tail tape measure protein [Mammaliicoccus sciuri]|uniref:phage tail tape measure protein n=1 Tax=Mammaliicoccus sciuri TaxID=1296 RepID=UPI001953F6AA|nr:phage tail tape measure protein [Mammaliicoccus sciuri]
MPNPVGNMVIKVDLDGSGFNKGVTGLNRQMRMVSKELSANLSKFSRYDNSLEKSKVKVDGLTKRQRVQKEIVKELRQNYDRLSAETGENSAKTQAAASKYNEAAAKLNQYDHELEEAKKHMKSLQDHQRALNNTLGKLGNNFSKFGPHLKTIGDGMKNVGRSMSMYVTAPIVGGFGAAVKASIDYESAFAGVRKTVNGSEKDYKKLSDGIIKMSKNLPVAATDIAEVGEMAGQLGIKKSNILDFSKTIIDLGESTNLTREQAATEFARFANIVDMPQKSFSRLGSSIVALGNNMATTESEIMSMSMRIAAQGKLVGMTESDITGLAATMSSLGIEAEAGGTAMTTVLKKIDKAVGAGGKELKAFADASGVSSAEFKKQWEKDPVKALDTFIGGLSKSKKEGANLSEMLADLGIKGIRESDTILRMANNHKLLGKAVQISGKGWKENKALSNEANQRYKTMASQLKILKNNVVAFGISLGDAIAPIVIKLAKGLTGVLKSMSNMSNGMKITIAVVGSLVAAIGPVVFIFGSFISVIGSAMTTLGPLLIGISKAGGVMAFLSGKVATLVKLFPTLGPAISFAGGPLLWIVGGLTALGIAFTVAYKKSETFRNIVNKAVSGVMNVFKAAKIALQGFFQLFKGNGQDGIITLSKIFPPNVVVGITSFADKIKNTFTQVVNAIKGFASQVGGQLTSFWNQNGAQITEAVQNIANVISTVFKFIWGNIIQPIMTLIWNLMKLLWPAIKALIVSVWNNIKGVIQGALNIILGTIKIFSSILTGNWKGAWNGLVQVLKGVVQLIWNLVQLWFVGKIVKVAKLGMSLLKGVFTKGWKFIHTFIATTAYAIWNSVKQKFSGLNKSIKAIVTSIKKWLTNTWSAIKKSVVNQAQSLWSGVKSKFSSLWKSTKSIFTTLKNWTQKTWLNLKKSVVKTVQNLYTSVKTRFNNLWKSTKQIFSNLRKWTVNTWNKLKNSIVKKAQDTWNGVKAKFTSLAKSTRTIFTNLKNWVTNKWKSIKNSVTNLANGARDNVVNGFKSMYNKGKSWLNKLKNFIGDSKEAFKKKAASLGKAAANGAISGLNKMIGGINKISKAITDKNLIKKIPKLSTGTSGAIKSPTAAIVNDKGPGNGSGPKGHQELIARRDGSLHAPIGRNVLVGLGKGDSVINGRHTQQLVRTGVIPQFHGGKNSEKEKDNILSQAKDKAGKFGADVMDTAHSAVDKSKKTVKAGVSAAKKGASYLGDKIGDVWDYVKNPKKLIDRMLGSINFGGSKANATMRMAGGAFKKLKKSLVGKVKSWFEEAEGGDGDAAWLFKHDIWQKFGAYTGGLGFNGGQHYGIDFGMTPGTKVKAVSGGRVSRVWNDYGGGKSIEIDIGNGLTNWYMHLNEQLVKKGQRIGVGDLIAKSGNTGNFTAGSGHLHFQLNKNGKPQSNVLEWLKGLGSGGSNKAASKWAPDIKRAAKRMKVNLSNSELKGIIAQIQRESNGNAGVTQGNIGDINNINGTPAQGLLQYVPSTFKAYKVKGHGNIKSGYDQLLAFFNNSNWRKDLPYGKSGWGPSGSRRFATGGKVWNGFYHLGEEGYPEWIIPSDPSRSNDAWKLLALAANDLEKNSPKSKRPNNLPNPSTGLGSSNSNLEKKFDMLLSLVSKLVSSNEAIANKDYEPVIDKYSLESEVFKLIEKYERTKSRKNRYNVAT